MTEQEAFDIVVKHLFEQKRPSMTREFSKLCTPVCAYRGEKGRKCAIGVLINDEEYSPELEMRGVLILNRDGDLPPSLAGLDIDFLAELQAIHDDAELTKRETFAMGALRANLRELAASRGLKANF